MENKRKEGLVIYEQISKKEDFIQGIGPKELTAIVIAAITGFVIGGVITKNTGQLAYGFISVVGITIIALAVVYRDVGGENLIDRIRLILKTLDMQRVYRYEYKETDHERTDDGK